MRKRTIIVNDRMQRGYRYALAAPAGRGFDPEFKPELTPAEMLGEAQRTYDVFHIMIAEGSHARAKSRLIRAPDASQSCAPSRTRRRP